MQSTIKRLLSGALPLCAAMASLHAAAFPTKTIHAVVPYPAGGVVDVQARIVLEVMSKELGQPIVVEAKPGANGSIAADLVARAASDGYTILVTAPFLINNPLLDGNVRWSPKDFAPVGLFSTSPSYMVVPGNSPAKTVKEFADQAKKANPKLLYASGGVGSTQGMANEIFKQTAGIQLEDVMYKGAPPAIPDLIAGRVDMGIIPSSVIVPQIKAGKVRALANTSHKRSAALPDVPTIAEAGFPEVTVLSWYGLHVPAGTPADVIKRLEAALRVATSLAEVKDRLAGAGGEESFMGTADFSGFLTTEGPRWEKLIKSLKIGK